MTYVIMSQGAAARGAIGPKVGSFLQWYDPDGDERFPISGWTEDLNKAKTFATVAAAAAEWNRVRSVDPVRPDGKPNKPLTAYSISIEAIEESP